MQVSLIDRTWLHHSPSRYIAVASCPNLPREEAAFHVSFLVALSHLHHLPLPSSFLSLPERLQDGLHSRGRDRVAKLSREIPRNCCNSITTGVPSDFGMDTRCIPTEMYKLQQHTKAIACDGRLQDSDPLGSGRPFSA